MDRESEDHTLQYFPWLSCAKWPDCFGCFPQTTLCFSGCRSDFAIVHLELSWNRPAYASGAASARHWLVIIGYVWLMLVFAASLLALVLAVSMGAMGPTRRILWTGMLSGSCVKFPSSPSLHLSSLKHNIVTSARRALGDDKSWHSSFGEGNLILYDSLAHVSICFL